ncbi:MAG: hypothetical protein RLZZ337_200 [Bacteroidota bacterium]|jgi:signal transduction histidine kinase
MKIRTRLTLQFLGIVALLMLLSCVAIYYFSSNYRKQEFYTRLLTKSQNTAKLLLDVDEIDLQLLERIEENNPLRLPNEHIIIYSFDNQVLYDSDKETNLTISNDLLDEIRLNKKVEFKQGNLEILGYLYTDKYDRIVVISAGQDIYGNRKIQNLLMIVIMVFCSSIFLMSILGWIYSGKALSPINQVITQVKRIGFSSLNLRVDEGENKDEIADLAHTFNDMLERLERSVQIQKNFIANASHEMRTPLTIITGQLEVLLRRERTVEQYQETSKSLLQDIENLNQTTNRLLLLAQTSEDKATDGFEPLRIDDILWQIKQELEKRNAENAVSIDFKLSENEDELLTVIGSTALLKVALLNLIENACKYSPNKKAEVIIHESEGGLVIDVKDSGIGIPKNDMPHIFEPFFRAKNATSIKGHGIGLSLSQRIFHLHKSLLTVQSTENKGSTFTVQFHNITNS